ncbi:Uncharacterised protein [Legionella steigerwaltii]|uniref:Uncharacterized protein n=1 Tax=Legionella steigerwaltii TaxID=460 RepID=A0A378LBV5_9GAMM|nr:hypothetical protein [Legionella steigerwaltii]KTD80930.1 hypothetical protein Lstg_0157 [Legionella steigerwaltii]STY23382.1 Uncharacterised protein [Legionella steigerwaltii]
MPFEYRSITANCGNDTLGPRACKKIKQLIASDGDGAGASFFVINCQEVHFGKTQKQLEALFPPGSGYKVECLSQMVTRTKLDTVFGTTGMATFVVCKEDLELTVVGKPVEARRSTDIPFGSAYNKGGLVTDFTVTRTSNNESIKVQAVTGHLDASDAVKRNQDWHNLNKATVKKVTTWTGLVSACPNLMLSGYDANTRDRLNQDGTGRNMWLDPNAHPEIHALDRVSLAASRFSRPVTYNHVKSEQELADRNRPGYLRRGMLDLVTIHGGNIPNGTINPQGIETDDVIQIEPEPNDSKRDHYVIISPPQTYTPLNEFDRVKTLMASRLYGVAPKVAETILAMKDDATLDPELDPKLQLLDYYNQYLGPDGFLDKAIGLHVDKLECVQRLMENPQNERLEKKLNEVLFDEREWCADEPKQLKAKQELMQALLDSLAGCEHATGIDARLNCYLALKEKIANKEEIDAGKALKDAVIKAYQAHYETFLTEVRKEPDFQLQEAMERVLMQLDAICDYRSEYQLEMLDPKKLDTMTHIIAQCYKSLNLAHTGESEEMEKINGELMTLSHEAMRSSSSLWRALAEAVKCFVSLVSNPTLTGQVGIVRDKELSDSIIKYNSALYKSVVRVPQEKEESDQLIGRPSNGG